MNIHWKRQMNATFQDLQNDNSPHNGIVIRDRAAVPSLLNELRTVRPPFMCQFIGDNGYNLLVGIDREFGCVQYSSNDGMPPFMMAVSKTDRADRTTMEFLVGDTPTPIDGRYRISFDELREIVADFAMTGQRSGAVLWKELE